MEGKGSAGNVIAALCSFFIPGLGQLLQGRLLVAGIHFILFCVLSSLWLVGMGWLAWFVHIWSTYSAATFRP